MNGGCSAFPWESGESLAPGLTKREYYIGEVLPQAMRHAEAAAGIDVEQAGYTSRPHMAAHMTLIYVDALLAELAKEPK